MAVWFAGSSGAERLQLKWFAAAAVLVVAAIIPLWLAPQIGLSPAAERTALSALKVVQTVAAFAAQLKDAVDLDTVREDLTRAVQTALEPAHVSVWTTRRE